MHGVLLINLLIPNFAVVLKHEQIDDACTHDGLAIATESY